MIIEKNKVVTVNYHLTSKNGNGVESLVEKTDKENPFVFLFGAGQLLEDFENNLAGKKVGDAFDFRIAAEKGYGERSNDNIVNLPLDVFKLEDGKFDSEMVKPGATVPMVDNEGNRLQGVVEEVTKDYVKMDFNHPLAGQELHFTGEVLEIRPATADELSHNHVHGPGGHHH